jgi:APA family basic amino acid/polyamine antiporter
MTTYARRLGLFSATMAVIGGIIGGGIFRTPASVAERVQSGPLFVVAWALGGVVALLGAFCFGELGARRPRAGGGYVYLRETFGPLPAFLYGWALLLVITSGACAAVAKTFAGYFLNLTGLSDHLTVPVAVGAIVLLAGINYVGVKPAAISQNIFTILKLTALATLIVVGLTLTVPYRPLASSSVPAPSVGIVVALGSALVPILFTYGGWQQTNFIAEEIIEPERNLPRALVLGVAVVVVVYLLANLSYLRVLGAEGLARSAAPAADLMRQLLGPVGGTVIAAGIAVSTFGFLNLVILVTPRVFQAMAADGVFFKELAELHPKYRTPTAAIALQAGWAIALTLWQTFSQLVDYVSFADWIFFGAAVAGLFVYRKRDRTGEAAVKFKAPFYPLSPALFVIAAAYVVLSAVKSNFQNAIVGTALLAAGIPVYYVFKTRRADGKEGAKQAEARSGTGE